MGHTMNRYGAIFNRLKELKKGDLITVQARDYTYTYEVYKTFVTEGLDMKILEDKEGVTQITLFCCAYNVKNGRLVVQGKLINKTPNN
jgi:LPXTG-site transpeptidase (sortase) family protein